MTTIPTDPAGPVAARVLALVADHSGDALRATPAERSPLGPRVIRLEPARQCDAEDDGRLGNTAAWLQRQSWVDAVAVRPTHLYVRVKTEALTAWVANAFTQGACRSYERSDGRSVVVRYLSCPDDPSLDLERQRLLAQAVGSTLKEQGLSVALDPVERAGSDEPPAAETVIVVGDAPTPGRREAVRLPVAPVDVCHGPLRARHGGHLDVHDLLDEVRRRGMAGAEVVPAILLLRTPRARRTRLDEDSLERESKWLASFVSLVDAFTPDSHEGRSVYPAPECESARRDLALALETLPAVASRCAKELEPAYAYRYLRSLTQVATSARSHVAAEDPLWVAAVFAINQSLALLGLRLDTPHSSRRRSTTSHT